MGRFLVFLIYDTVAFTLIYLMPLSLRSRQITQPSTRCDPDTFITHAHDLASPMNFRELFLIDF